VTILKGTSVVPGSQFASNYILKRYLHSPNNILPFLVSLYIK